MFRGKLWDFSFDSFWRIFKHFRILLYALKNKFNMFSVMNIFTYFIAVDLSLIIKFVFLLFSNFYSTYFSSKFSIHTQDSIGAKVDLYALLWYLCWSDFNFLCSSTMFIDLLTSCDGKIIFQLSHFLHSRSTVFAY